MGQIAVTGTTGNVGRQALEAFGDHELTPISRTEYDDIETELLDVADRERFVELMAGHDSRIHLAANPSQSTEWDSVVGPNIEGTYNAYEAAIRNDLDRVVFASTNHIVNRYNVDDPEVDTRFATSMFLSPRDCRQAMVAATTTELSANPITTNILSRNDRRFLSLRSPPTAWLPAAGQRQRTAC